MYTFDLSRPCAEDKEAVDLIDQATQGKHGGDHTSEASKTDNISLDTNQHGTSRQQALRKLRKSRPDLHAQVLKGKLSPHAAMIEAKEARPWKAAPLRFSVHTEASATNKLRPFLRLDPRMCQIVDFTLDLEPRRFILRLIQPVELRP